MRCKGCNIEMGTPWVTVDKKDVYCYDCWAGGKIKL